MKKLLQPIISIENAESLFQELAKKKKLKIFPSPHLSLMKTEMLYLPFFIFEIELEEKGTIRHVRFSADGIEGIVSPYSPESESHAEQTDCQTYDFVITKSEAEMRVRELSRGLVLEHGLKFNRNASVKQIEFREKIHFPFWIFYFQKKGRYDFKAMDAVSGEFTPIKMRQLFLKVFGQK